MTPLTESGFEFIHGRPPVFKDFFSGFCVPAWPYTQVDALTAKDHATIIETGNRLYDAAHNFGGLVHPEDTEEAA